ncbi:MAG: hypothetical protein WCB18_04680 [Thermoplasmata archaeon]
MARRKIKAKAGARKPNATRPSGPRIHAPKSAPATPRFVGREGSPVLAKYPTKEMDAAVGEAPVPKPAPLQPAIASTARSAAVPTSPVAQPTPAAPRLAQKPAPDNLLISLEKPFDVDDFAQLLGQTQIQVTVPRDSLAEVLRRACDFMGFGIYVYSIRVRPGPEELLKTFIVELQRVDFSTPVKDWVPFQDRGRADSPFGPTGTR